MSRQPADWVTPRTLSITPALRRRVIARQKGRCSTCKELFQPGDKIELDHGHPLQFGGPDIEANLFAKHKYFCHSAKTKADAAAAARIRKIVGITKKKKGRKLQGGKKLQSAGFQKNLTRGFNGITRPRKQKEQFDA